MTGSKHGAASSDPTTEFPLKPPAEVHVEYEAISHVGNVRDTNEDHFVVADLTKSIRVLRTNLPRGDAPRLADQRAYLFAIADGMGGAAAGERASALVIAEMERHILETTKWFFHRHERDDETLKREVDRGLRRIDQIVFDEGEADWSRAGMGTTLTLALSFGQELTVVHVGDSRAYLFRSGRLDRITRDHTLAQLLVDGGMMSPDEAALAKTRHVLTNVLGGPSPGVSGEVHRLHIQNGDRLLLCSDGLTNMVSEAEVTRLLSGHSKPEEACRILIDAALAAGGRDNVTVVLADFAFQKSAQPLPSSRS
jgi:PPM family protein phosphatase